MSAATIVAAAVAARESGGEGHESGCRGLKGAPKLPIWNVMELRSEVTSASTEISAVVSGSITPAGVSSPTDPELEELAETVDRLGAVMDLLALNASLEAMLASQRSMSADSDAPDTAGLAGLVARLSGTHRELGVIASDRTARFEGGSAQPHVR